VNKIGHESLDIPVLRDAWVLHNCRMDPVKPFSKLTSFSLRLRQSVNIKCESNSGRDFIWDFLLPEHFRELSFAGLEDRCDDFYAQTLQIQ